jgi:hypothetical protein
MRKVNQAIVHINLNKKLTRKRSAGNLQAAFEVAGNGNRSN